MKPRRARSLWPVLGLLVSVSFFFQRRTGRGLTGVVDMHFAGSKYGGWWFNKMALGERPVIYSFGLGEDTSWDEAMLQLGAEVYGFDPTPKAAAYVKTRQQLNRSVRGKFVFTEEGLACESGVVTFSLPKNPSHVSLRRGEISDSGGLVELKVDTLSSFLARNGHTHIDILKIDIEGSEYDVLEDMLQRKFYPFTQLLVEFHRQFHGFDEQRHTNLLSQLTHAGFVINKIDATNEVSFQRFQR